MLVAMAVAILTMEGACDNARVRQSNADWLADPRLNFIVCHVYRPFTYGKSKDDLTRYQSCLLPLITACSKPAGSVSDEARQLVDTGCLRPGSRAWRQ